jgi:glycine/D-amino acid oxidase-like deaminating enzyme
MTASAPRHGCLWEETSPEPRVDTHEFPEGSAFHVAIVGAGYTGLSCALTLAEAGRRVIVLEAGEPGHGGSGRNGGQVQAGFGTSLSEFLMSAPPEQAVEISHVANTCADELFALVEKHKIRCEAVRSGLIRGIHHPRLFASIRAKAEADSVLKFMDRRETAHHLGADIYHGAVYDPRCGRINPMAYARGLARAAAAAGIQIVSQCRAEKLIEQAGGWSLETPKGTIKADQVVLATEAYADDLCEDLKRSIVVVNSFQIATAPFEGGPLAAGEVASDTRRLVFYYRRDGEGRLIVGSRGSRTGFDRFEKYAFLRNWLAASYPMVAQVPITHYWAGQVAITLDRVPHAHNPRPGLHIVTGYNGKGVAMATAIGNRLACRIIDDRPEILALPVRPLRPIPFWIFRNLGVAAHVALYRQLDRWGW